MADTVKLTIDGQEVFAPKGMNLIEAAKTVGIEVPHYCYHPKLTIAGNCRMCLVDTGMPKLGPDKTPVLDPEGKPVIVFGPKLAIGCNTTVAEGMVVHTRTEKVVKAREGVMEFLLINHPLDCPICDQAGECRLQEFSVDYGKGESRFIEEKVHKPKKSPIGEKIMLDDERCILCSRCVRFMKEVAGQDCLGFVNRGSYSTLTCYPGQEPKTNYDLNIVDICPVGALTSNDFRFQQRVWFLKETKSVCPHCATGCNTVLWSREGVVYRQTPRDNDAVNSCWMCDYGRLNFKFINDPHRLTTPVVRSAAVGERFNVTWVEATRQIAERLQALAGQGRTIAGIASASATTEELFLFRKVMREVLQAEWLDCVTHAGEADGFLLQADRSSNTTGARLTGVATGNLAKIVDGIQAGTIKTLIVLGENVAGDVGRLCESASSETRRFAEAAYNTGITVELLEKLELLVVIDTLPSPTTGQAHFVLPGATFAEKRGTFINGKGRLQRLNAAIQPPGIARAEWQTLAALLNELGGDGRYLTLEDVFADMARTIPALAGLNLSRIGDQGVELKLDEVKTEAVETPSVTPLEPQVQEFKFAEEKSPKPKPVKAKPDERKGKAAKKTKR
jgi:NADH-quinone oxidoreductase subunit G